MNRRTFLGGNKVIAVHMAGWLIYTVYEISFIAMTRGLNANASVWSGYVIPYSLNISLFYFHAFKTMQTGFGEKQNKVLLFLALVIAEVAVYLLLMGMKDLNFLKPHNGFFTSLYPAKAVLVQQLWRGLYFLIFSTAFWLIHQSFKKEQEKKQLELKLISTQNAFLQAQINPHLLFNTLNFIHSEVQQVAPKASDAIITLSDMMRYSLAETKTDGKVELEREIEQIDNLIKVNQLRFNNKLCINVAMEGAFDEQRIYPLLLVPFVENLFKYAALTEEENPVHIAIKLSGNLLLFQTFNQKRKAVAFRSPGIGIKNVETRLNAYYKDRFSLAICDEASTFSVKLSIAL